MTFFRKGGRVGLFGFLGFLALLLVLLVPALPVLAVTPEEKLADPALEARARVISQELRCVVCQNQSIDDSNAPLAKDLRVLVRDRLKAGDSNREAVDFIVARYGNFVLLNPPVQTNTLMLWFAPALLGLGVLVMMVRYLRHQQALAPAPGGDGQADAAALAVPDDFSAEEAARLREILKKGSDT